MNQPRLTAETSVYKTNGVYRLSRGFMATPGVNLSQQSGVPGGSYQQSCSDCFVWYRINGGVTPVLSCSCRDFNGNLQATSLYDPFSCGADIANCNGYLLCGPCETILN